MLGVVGLVFLLAVGCGEGDSVTASDSVSEETVISEFGADTPGGRGGRIIRVTNLNDSGVGSFRSAVEASGPRIVVFEVGGVIDVHKRAVNVRNPYLTVAGQTAPSPGITVIRGGFYIQTHDVIVQHIRVRPGDAGDPKGSGWEPDGISIYGTDAYNVVIDHCSVSWAVDENMSASGARTEGPEATARRVTFRHCIIAEGLVNATHSKGSHSMGSLIHDYCREIAIVGNLYAHNNGRNPYFKAFTTGVIVNNAIYNPGGRAIQLGFATSEWDGTGLTPENCRVSIVGNVLIHGRDTRTGLALVSSQGDAYLEDNLARDRSGRPVDITSGDIVILDVKPIWGAWLAPRSVSTVEEDVAAHAGARPKDRDAVDARIVHDFLGRGGGMIDSQDEVGGYPQVEMVTRLLDIPSDVDAWLARLAAEIE